MKRLIYASLAPLLLVACGSNNENETADAGVAADETGNMAQTNADSAATTTATAAAPTDAMGYVAKAGASDMFEIESSKAALAKSTNADTKKFAQMMVDHHTQSTTKVMTAAKSANVTPPPAKLEPMQQQMLDEIKSADAAGIDQIYMKHQRTAHLAALALHQGFAKNGDTEAFKKAAGEIAPVVQKHLAELDKMGSM